MKKKDVLTVKMFTVFVSFITLGYSQSSCPPTIADPNDGLLFQCNYNNSSAWTFDPTSNNPITIANGELNYTDVYTGTTERIYTASSTFSPHGNYLSLYYNQFRAEFKLNLTDALCPSHLLLAFSNGISDVTSGSSTNEAIGVMLTTDESIPPGNSYMCDEITDTERPWKFKLMTKYGSTFFSTHDAPDNDYITVPAFNQDYYVRLIRSGTDVCLSVCTDAAFTQHVSGSPDCFDNVITSDNGPYYFVQQGGRQGAYNYRRASLIMDSLRVFGFSNESGFNCSNREAFQSSGLRSESIRLIPNPSTGNFTIEGLDNIADFPAQIKISDLTGRIFKQAEVKSSSGSAIQFDASSFPNGIYLIEVVGKNQTWKTKISINK